MTQRTDEPTYSESARGVWVTEARAIREINDHGIHAADDVAEILADTRRRNGRYSAHSLLRALGY